MAESVADDPKLGLKDVATLYELWCYFAVVDAVRAVIGRRPDAITRSS